MALLGQMDLEQLKVPLGFLKVIELPMAIISFTSFKGYRFELEVSCNGSRYYSAEWAGISIDEYMIKVCNGSTYPLFGDEYGSHPSNFYAYLSLLTMAFALIMMFIYVFRWDAYAGDDRLPRYDTGATILFSILWFLTFWTWWWNSSNLEAATTADNVRAIIDRKQLCRAEDSCTFTSYSMYAPVTVSVIAALANTILFAYNIWIAYKETVWFRERQMNQQPHTLT